MTTSVKVQVQPGQTVNFPGICVHDMQPAVTTMRISARTGRVTREIDVPISEESAAELFSTTVPELRIKRVGLVGSILLAMMTAIAVLSYFPALVGFTASLALSIATGVVLGYLFFRGLRRLSLRWARAEKMAVRAAVRIEHFSWRATTFAFVNDAYADLFSELNQAYLMEPPHS